MVGEKYYLAKNQTHITRNIKNDVFIRIMHNKIGNKRLPYNKKYKKGNISLDKNCINCYYGFRWIEESIINVKYWIVTGEAGKTKFYKLIIQ